MPELEVGLEQTGDDADGALVVGMCGCALGDVVGSIELSVCVLYCGEGEVEPGVGIDAIDSREPAD